VNRYFLATLLVLVSLGSTTETPSLPRFVDVAASAGIRFKHVSGGAKKNYIFEAKGGGVALLDYDLDGLLDIYFVNGSTIDDVQKGRDHGNALYRANGDGTYSDVTQKAGVRGKGWAMGCSVADYDNDGDPDIYVLGLNRNILFRNNRDGTFSDVSEESGLKGGRWSTSAAFTDYDRDGDLDVYVANNIDVDIHRSPLVFRGPDCDYRGVRVMCGPRGLPGAQDSLYQNNGDGTFTDVTVKAGVVEPQACYGLGVATGDYNNDGWPDIYVANDSTPSYLWENQKDGTFREVGLLAGVAVSEDGMEQAGMGIDLADYDNDGWLDITKSNFSFDHSNLYRNEKGMFDDRSKDAGLAGPSMPYVCWGTRFIDYDNDGWKDILIATGHVYPHLIAAPAGGEKYYSPRVLLKNLRNGHFEDVSDRSGPGIKQEKSSRGMATGDLDNDGDLDAVIVNMDDHPSVLRNDGGNIRNWLIVRLRGIAGNRFGVGARLTARAGALVQTVEATTSSSIFSANDSRVHFGLGSATRVDLEISWPSGRSQSLRSVDVNRILDIQEPEQTR